MDDLRSHAHTDLLSRPQGPEGVVSTPSRQAHVLGTWRRRVSRARASGDRGIAAHPERAVAAELALISLAEAAAAGWTSQQVLERVTAAAATLAGPATVHIWLVGLEGRDLHLAAASGARSGRQDFPLQTALNADDGLVGQIALRRTPLVVTSLRREPQLVNLAWAREQGFVSFAGVPLARGERLLGVLGLFTWGRHRFTRREVSLLCAFAAHAAVALENAQLFEALTHTDQALRSAQEQLVRAEKLRALGEMAAGVAHDFNNLLGVILARVQMVRGHVTHPRLTEWLQIAEQAAQDGAQIVRQIREFTRVEHRTPVQAVDLNQVIRDAVEMTRPRWEGPTAPRAGAIEVVLQLGELGPVDGQPAELREVLMNLMVNAVDALRRGGQLRIATRPARGGVEVSVADTGTGMSEAVRRRMFEPFFTTKGARGAGLGLAMVYGIVARHRGTIAVDSVEGRGSTFTMWLPAGRLPLVTPAVRPGPSGPALRVLVIDDDETVREALADMLRLQDHQVDLAEDGAEGLTRLGSRSYDVVLTDLAMPGMSGWEVVQAMKTCHPEVPVAVVTGTAVEVSPEALRVRGIDAVVAKPVAFEDLQTVLARVRRARCLT
jgi:signal transduction histidine kinase/CheY-like chemotaxis protein